MKSTITAFWLLTEALGNLLLMLFASSAHIFAHQFYEYLFFSGVMFVAISVFSILAYLYQSSNRLGKSSADEQIINDQEDVNY